MSRPPHCDDQKHYDSDATFCSEVEEKSSRRIRKKTTLYQAKSNSIINMEHLVERAIKHPDALSETHRVLTKLQKFQPKNKADQDAVSQLTQKLETFAIKDAQALKNNLKNRCKKKTLCKFNWKASKEPSFDLGTLTGSTYDALQDTQNFSNSHADKAINYSMGYDAFEKSEHHSDPRAVQTLTNLNNDALQEPEHNFITDNHANRVSNVNFNAFQESQLNFCAPLPLIKSDASEEKHDFRLPSKSETLSSTSYSQFEHFMSQHFSDSLVCNDDRNPHSVSIDEPNRQKNQQLIDQYLMPKSSDATPTLALASETLNELEHLTEKDSINQMCSTVHKTAASANTGAIPKAVAKRKIAGKRGRKRVTQDEGQTTIPDFFNSKNENKKEDETRQTDVLKKEEEQPDLKQAIEMLEICRTNFLLRLKARKEQILQARAVQVSSELDIELDNLCIPYCSLEDKGKGSLQINCYQSGDSDEKLQNMKDLFEISARYSKMYKIKEIDILSD